MYVLHTYHGSDGYRWGLIAENHEKLGDGGQGYSNREDMEEVLSKLFVPARGSIVAQNVPWEDCSLHNSKQGKCYRHSLVDARMLARSLQEGEHAPSPHDP